MHKKTARGDNATNLKKKPTKRWYYKEYKTHIEVGGTTRKVAQERYQVPNTRYST